MQGLICIPIAIASQSKSTQAPILATSFEVRYDRYRPTTKLGEFGTGFYPGLANKSDLDVFLTRPAELEVGFQLVGTLEPRQNKVEIATQFALLGTYWLVFPRVEEQLAAYSVDSTFSHILGRTQEQLSATGVEWGRSIPNSSIGELSNAFAVTSSKPSVRSREVSFPVETSLSSGRVLPRSNAIASNTDFGIIATRKQI